MAKHCHRHDITGDECWCCEEELLLKKGPEAREAAYRDPNFLAKRGGAGLRAVIVSQAMHRLAELSPDALENLIAMAEGRAPGAVRPAGRTVIAAG